jgi:NADH dehydrogenase
MTLNHVVTGAFGYSGAAIARELLARGHTVRTLTASGSREHPLAGRVLAAPLDFTDPDGLARSLEGVDVLHNTYWVRFSAAGFSQDRAVQNTGILFDAAHRAGVRRVVHVSITNPSEDSPYEYFRGKARLERRLADTGLPHSILRPAVLFGGADVLLNNIAWLLRRLPVFGLFGDGSYRLQPIHVDDLARLAADEAERAGARTVDAIGPETLTFRELVELLGRAVGAERRTAEVPPWLGLAAARVLGLVLRDVVLTAEEIGALMDGLLATDSEPVGDVRLSEWAPRHADELGRRYASELARRRDRRTAYARL